MLSRIASFLEDLEVRERVSHVLLEMLDSVKQGNGDTIEASKFDYVMRSVEAMKMLRQFGIFEGVEDGRKTFYLDEKMAESEAE